jgi:CCR4-NOT transcription complex subunit 1
MAQKLAGSLALVTCKEPLRSNLGTHLRQHLAEHGFAEVMSAPSFITACTEVWYPY